MGNVKSRWWGLASTVACWLCRGTGILPTSNISSSFSRSTTTVLVNFNTWKYGHRPHNAIANADFASLKSWWINLSIYGHCDGKFALCALIVLVWVEHKEYEDVFFIIADDIRSSEHGLHNAYSPGVWTPSTVPWYLTVYRVETFCGRVFEEWEARVWGPDTNGKRERGSSLAPLWKNTQCVARFVQNKNNGKKIWDNAVTTTK